MPQQCSFANIRARFGITMFSGRFNDELTNLLVSASVQHLNLCLETLPVGRIEVCRFGQIRFVDEWTEALLGIDAKELIGVSLEDLVGAKAFGLMMGMPIDDCGQIGSIDFRTSGGATVSAFVVLVPGINSSRVVFELICTDIESS